MNRSELITVYRSLLEAIRLTHNMPDHFGGKCFTVNRFELATRFVGREAGFSPNIIEKDIQSSLEQEE